MNKLLNSIEQGKCRGYDEFRTVDGITFLYQYALKKENGNYKTYYFSIPESKMDVIEDYGIEEIEVFNNLSDAITNISSKNGEIKKFGAIKVTLPF